jgi:hypothetical protein
MRGQILQRFLAIYAILSYATSEVTPYEHMDLLGQRIEHIVDALPDRGSDDVAALIYWSQKD